MGELEGKCALVTGAAQGIGEAIATLFRSEGARVITLDRQPGVCDLTLDLSNTSEIDPCVASLDYCPEILVNAAGICLTRPFFEIDLAGFERTLSVNVLGLFALMQSVAGRMVAEGVAGSIVNITSNSGFLPKREQLDYGASKAAVVSVTRSAAISLAEHGIRVNAVAPGVIDTPLTRSIAEERSKIRGVPPEETLRPVIEGLPMRRMGGAEEVAQIALFLASDRSSYVTGQTYLVDGGQVMR